MITKIFKDVDGNRYEYILCLEVYRNKCFKTLKVCKYAPKKRKGTLLNSGERELLPKEWYEEINSLLAEYVKGIDYGK